MTPNRGPDLAEARRRYDAMARRYDRGFSSVRGLQERLRRRAIRRLDVAPGATVLDVGCGTGASFGFLVDAVGPEGRVVGVDQSNGMLDVARDRIHANGWDRVELIDRPVQTARLPSADAALFFFTHDLMRTDSALDNVLEAVRPGGRLVAAGARRPPGIMAPVGVAAWLVMRRYVTTSDGVSEPWTLLADRLQDFTVERLVLGAIYIAQGVAPPSGDTGAA